MRIFVSYRRADSAGWTGRLTDALMRRFGKANVFYDLDSVRPGVDYVQEVTNVIARSHCALAVIGPEWLTVTNSNHARRLDDRDDPVRMELSLALKSKARVIPVLVGGARMPSAAELTEDLRTLATRNAVRLTDERWADDVRHLITSLSGAVWWQRICLAALALTEVALVALWIYQSTLQNAIGDSQSAAAALRQQYLQKMRSGTDECMAGTWPEGAIKGPTYKENGNLVTELCSGVSGELDFFQRFFNDEELWRMQPSLDTARKFADTYRDTFGPGFEKDFLATGWSRPLSSAAVALAEKAKGEIGLDASKVVSLEHAAAKARQRLMVVQTLTRVGLFWTVLVGFGLIVWFTRGAVRF